MSKSFKVLSSVVVAFLLSTNQQCFADEDKQNNSATNADVSSTRLENPASRDGERKGDSDKSNLPVEKADQKQQVQKWFAQYDQIRRDAEMTLLEKLQSHSLFTKGLEGDRNNNSSDKSTKFATSMTERYTEASGKIKALPELANTADLQKGYAEFFTRCSNLFHEYLSFQKSEGDRKEIRTKLLSNKEKLSALDKENKALDSKLRMQYGIKAHKHK